MKSFESHPVLSTQLQQYLQILASEMPDVVSTMTPVQRPVFLRDTLLLQTRGSWSLGAPHRLVTPLIEIDPGVADCLSFVCNECVYLYSPHPEFDDTLTIRELPKTMPVIGLPAKFGFVFTERCSILVGKDTTATAQVLCDGVFL